MTRDRIVARGIVVAAYAWLVVINVIAGVGFYSHQSIPLWPDVVCLLTNLALVVGPIVVAASVALVSLVIWITEVW